MTSKDRLALYQDPSVQLLLSKFVRGEIVELVPSFDLSQTVRYPEVEEVVEGDSGAAKQLVEKLWDVGIFKRKFHEKILVCPSCVSVNVSNDYVCPNCNSIDIERKTLLEHTVCGNIDSVDNFLIEGGLLCPKCNRELLEAGVDYQKLGAWFQCSQCGKRSDMPSPIHRCRNCGHIFTIRDTGFVNIYAYRLGSEAEEEFKRSYLVMKPIGMVLEDFQFKVEMPGQIAGRSGALHRFDAVATKGASEVVVLDFIASEKQIDEVAVASMYAKIFDVAPTQSILVAMPRLTEKAKRLAGLYRISTIEAENSQQAADQIKDKFGWAGLSGNEESLGDLQL
ncbi:MAG TPA: hypothetical protein VN949_00390 [Candidatus Limnocylindrales bacterium]|nr:hypothetical protein [Candidatus Limnocylindrales bacterium]